MDLVSKSIGPYQIVEEIGRGGMAVVYKAWQPSLERYVALKVLPEYYRHDPQFLARFQREARAAASFSHPHIIPIYDTGQAGGQHYMAMEYLEGGSLADRLAAGRVGLDEAQRIVEQVASALDYSHAQGLIHRDIKPANILFTADPLAASRATAKVTDFGIVRAADGTRLTRTGVLLGTPEYMSPEQAEGRQVDHRTDLYALGVVLYQMLTGQAPFRGTTPYAIMHATIYQAPPPPREVNPRLSSALEAVLLKALAKDPGQRFQRGADLAEALRRAREGVTVEVPVSARQHAEAAAPGRPRVQSGAVILAVAAVVVVALAGWLLLSSGSSGAEGVAATAQALTRAAEVQTAGAYTATAIAAVGGQATLDARATEDAKRWEDARLTAEAMDADSATGTAEALLGEQMTATVNALQRQATETALAGGTEIAEAVRQTADAMATQVAVDATQTALARPTETYTPTPTPRPTDTPTPAPQPNPPDTPTPTTPPPAPSAGRIAFVSDRDGNRDIYTMKAGGGGVTRLTTHPEEERFLAWSPNGQRAAFTSKRDGNWEVYVMNADGSGQRNLTNHPSIDRRPWWSPDGSRIVFVSDRDGDHDIFVMNADGSGQRNLTQSSGRDRAPSWSPDGRRIAFMSERHDGSGEIYVMNPDGSGVARLTHSAEKDTLPVWSPDSKRIVFMSERDGNAEIYVMNADGSGQTNLTRHPAEDWDPSWSPDGKRIAFSSKRTDNRDVFVMNTDGSGVTNLTNHPAYDGQPCWAPQ